MDTDELVPGMRFVVKHSLTKEETRVLLVFFDGELTTKQAAEILERPPLTIHQTITRLKHKGILVISGKDDETKALYYRYAKGRKNEPGQPLSDPRTGSNLRSDNKDSK